jgi:hypothetical protein
MAYDAIDIRSQICHVDGDSCHEFDRWLELKRSGLRVDFRRVERVGSGLQCLKDYVVNLSRFEEGSNI